ncbi:MAG: hypothetical protein NXI21_12700 [Alphaproteobacteria bacterium]|nr:hypothetical protein [Alphaproteobacteria bacterium]
MKIGRYEAKSRLPELLRRVELGERVLITRRDRVVAELRPPSARSDEEAAAPAAPVIWRFEAANALLQAQRRGLPLAAKDRRLAAAAQAEGALVAGA